MQKSGIGARLDIGPNAPFIDVQTDAFAAVELIHDGRMLRNQLVHVQPARNALKVELLAKPRCRPFVAPALAGDGVIMRAKRINKTGAFFHQNAGPIVIPGIGAAADSNHVAVVMPGVTGIGFHQIGVMLRGHFAAAAPVFVANADVLDIPRFLAAIFSPQVGHFNILVRGHVHNPVDHFLDRAGADIGGDVRIAAKQFAQV